MTSQDEFIPMDQDDLVEKVTAYAQSTTIEVWVTPEGGIFTNERSARYSACTHRPCDIKGCEDYTKKRWTICKKHRDKKWRQKYEELNSQMWDGQTPIKIWRDEKFFWSEDDLMDWCAWNDRDPTELQLVHCEHGPYPQLDIGDLFYDYLPMNVHSDELHEELHNAVKALNTLIQKHAPYSWIGNNVAVELPDRLIYGWEEYKQSRT